MPALERYELELMRLLAAGALNKQAASELGVSLRTVEGYRQRVMKKLGARSSCQLGYLFAQMEAPAQEPMTLSSR